MLFLNSAITQITVERKQDQQMSVTLVQLAYLPVCVEITKYRRWSESVSSQQYLTVLNRDRTEEGRKNMPAVLRELNNFIFIFSTQQKQQTAQNNPAKKYANGQSLNFNKSVRRTRFLGGEESHTPAKICFLKAKMPDTNTQFIQLKNDSTLELKGLTRCKWRTVLILV